MRNPGDVRIGQGRAPRACPPGFRFAQRRATRFRGYAIQGLRNSGVTRFRGRLRDSDVSQIRPLALRKPSATSSTVFLSTSTLALSLAIVSSLSFAETE